MKILDIEIKESNLSLEHRVELLRKAGYPEAAEKLIQYEKDISRREKRSRMP